jgi:tetratricopeptide (TPR) repeat protein
MNGRTTSRGRRALAATLNASGGAFAFSGRLRPAQRCFALALRVLGNDRSLAARRAVTLNRLGVVEKTAGHHDLAAHHYAQAVATMESVGAQPLPFVAAMEHNLAGLLLARGEAVAAETHARRAVDARRRAGASAVDLATDRVVVAATLAAQGRSDEARSALGDALSTLEQTLGENHYEVGSALVVLGALEQERDPERAERHYERALAIKQRTRGMRHPEVGIVHNNLGVLYRSQGRDELARDHFDVAARLLRRYGPDHPATRTCRGNIDELAAMRERDGVRPRARSAEDELYG